mmetsp:Transcript_6165/g.7176  ORF Transcript_6165/g.7176 Transcript_6165/m.7176 type:complete len:276 (-) Transcript_6165:357-1184(-)
MKTNYDSVSTADPIASKHTVRTANHIPMNTTMLTVSAPLDLPEGYRFFASYQRAMFPVIVPVGGVTRGQLLEVSSQQLYAVDNSVAGRWKDDVADCSRFGCCHPSNLNACFCPFIILGQLMMRLKINCCGNPVPSAYAFCSMLLLTVGFILSWALIFSPFVSELQTMSFLGSIKTHTDDSSEMDEDTAQNQFYTLGFKLQFALVFLFTWRVRKHIRAVYRIPERLCIGCEDICCSFWCGCIVLSQMARHTTEYEQQKAQCCSVTGVLSTDTVLTV